jgi:hypothetical protein
MIEGYFIKNLRTERIDCEKITMDCLISNRLKMFDAYYLTSYLT